VTARNSAWVLAATEHGPMIVNRHDRVVTSENPLTGYGVGFQLLERGCYDPEEVQEGRDWLDHLRGERPTPITVVDCGANVGVMTVDWARHMSGWGRVFAFEPQERVYYALAGNVALNNLDNARAIWAAVGREPGEVAVPGLNYSRPGSHGSLSLCGWPNDDVGQFYEGASFTVPVRTIDEALGGARVDLIKVDVEGMEIDVLEGARETVTRHRPILIVEHLKLGKGAPRAWMEALGYATSERASNLVGLP
jgi:FkbM family methyltransferase